MLHPTNIQSITFQPQILPPQENWNFILQVTDAAGHSVNSTAAAVTVNTPPPSALTVSITPTSVKMDAGQSAIFTANPSGGSGNYTSYQWYINDVAQQGENASTFTYYPSAAGTPIITVTVTDNSSTTPDQSNVPSTIVYSVLVSPTVAPSSGTVDLGQTSTLNSSSVTSGDSPYTYQWFSLAPGASAYTLIGGATLSSYNFSTTTSTTTGAWSFIIQVTDNAGAAMNSTATSVNVNAALVAPSASPSIGTINQGQASSLNSTSIATGTSPYSYQWFSMDPGSSTYSLIVGATQPGYNFTTSTGTEAGKWSFILQTTDNTGAAVNSTALTVSINAPVSTSGLPSWVNWVIVVAVIAVIAVLAILFISLRRRRKNTNVSADDTPFTGKN